MSWRRSLVHEVFFVVVVIGPHVAEASGLIYPLARAVTQQDARVDNNSSTDTPLKTELKDQHREQRRSAFLHPSAAKIYVVDIPAKYASQIVEQYKNNRTIAGDCEYDTSMWGISLSNPFGDLVDSHFHFRFTNQFDIDTWLYAQLLQSPLRVRSFDDADLVFVPGMFMRFNKWCNPDEAAILDSFLSDYTTFLPNVTTKPHVVGYSRTGWDNYKLFTNDTRTHDLTFTSLEHITSEVYAETNQRLVPLPYPSHVHFSRGSGDYFEPFNVGKILEEKKILVSGSWVSRLDLRVALKQHCIERPNQCVHQEFIEFDPVTREFAAAPLLIHWDTTHRSWYCLQPPGDTVFRRSTWDCLMAGTIPVVFEEDYYHYMAFKEHVNWRNIIIYIPRDAVQGETGRNVIDIIQEQHNVDECINRLALLHSVRHILQYSLNPVHELVRFDLMKTTHREDDAFTVGLRQVMHNLCYRKLIPEERCHSHQASSILRHHHHH